MEVRDFAKKWTAGFYRVNLAQLKKVDSDRDLNRTFNFMFKVVETENVGYGAPVRVHRDADLIYNAQMAFGHEKARNYGHEGLLTINTTVEKIIKFMTDNIKTVVYVDWTGIH